VYDVYSRRVVMKPSRLLPQILSGGLDEQAKASLLGADPRRVPGIR